jgi:hypothetical protein
VFHALEAELELSVRWRGGQLERLLDEGHAHLIARSADLLERLGWSVRLEVTYETPRSSGSIDVLAFEPQAGALIVIEVKTELLSAESTIRKLDEKSRIAASVATDRFAWPSTTVSRLLVLPGSTSTRRALERRGDLFDRAYPLRGRALGRWLRRPGDGISGIWILPITGHGGGRTELSSRRRIRRRSSDASPHG